MKIKTFSGEKIPLDVKEWNEEVRAFIKPMNGFERLTFNDLFLVFYNKENGPEERFDAGFRAALLVLVDDEDRPLLTESDREAVRSGSFLPLFRLFNLGLGAENSKPKNLETLKKN